MIREKKKKRQDKVHGICLIFIALYRCYAKVWAANSKYCFCPENVQALYFKRVRYKVFCSINFKVIYIWLRQWVKKKKQLGKQPKSIRTQYPQLSIILFWNISLFNYIFSVSFSSSIKTREITVTLILMCWTSYVVYEGIVAIIYWIILEHLPACTCRILLMKHLIFSHWTSSLPSKSWEYQNSSHVVHDKTTLLSSSSGAVEQCYWNLCRTFNNPIPIKRNN